jgi:gas vesicle protein
MEEKTIVIRRGAFGAFLRGALFGAGIALLLAPRSGRETRMMLSEKGHELRDRAMDMANTTRDRAETVVRDTRDRAETFVQDTRVRAENVVNDARNRLDDKIQGVKEGWAAEESKTEKQLKRELEISEDIENPIHPL